MGFPSEPMEKQLPTFSMEKIFLLTMGAEKKGKVKKGKKISFGVNMQQSKTKKLTIDTGQEYNSLPYQLCNF